MNKGKSLSATGYPGSIQGQSLRVLAILSTLMSFASISTDLYLPALPAMGASLHADAGAMELTISGYLIGFSIGQLFWGPISDRYGRRLPIAQGLLLFIVGSAGCALSRSVPMMIAWRLVQAVGACANVVLSRAMVRDIYVGHQAARMLSVLITAMAVAPLIGPSLGGLILHVGSWQAIFWLLVAVGLLTLWSLTVLPETLPPERRNPQSILSAFLGYAQLLRHPRLLAYTGVGGCFYGGMFAYVAGTPAAYISYHQVSPQHYGLLFALGIVGIMVANQLNARLVRRFGIDRLIRFGARLATVSGAVAALDTWYDWGGLLGLVLPLLFFASATGFIVANAIVGALEIFPDRAGLVSALIGALQYGTGIFGSACVGYFANGTPFPMGLTIAGFGLGSFLFCLGLGSRK
ncbi:multidrug effflux MFS transporter [Azospira inquinata]|uniref:Bcr/CflA family efflux transporter n=1 Tax=Azospira inquinata TaxID=2785627 RepID=A0A975XVU5_9RHOO|nr:multidrug effflux MFS transporter [Azospira inquinata]QWT47175.1 multidrug effflux MFS transporter [Azospira inquinata]QWT50194.1 multidrug effflux MFS transporter [Azospira inquinata]